MSCIHQEVRQGVRLVPLHGEENTHCNLLSSRSAKKAKESEVSVSPPVSGSPSFTGHDIDSELALEDAQELVDNWVIVSSFVTYRRRQGIGVTQAAQEAPFLDFTNAQYDVIGKKGMVRQWWLF